MRYPRIGWHSLVAAAMFAAVGGGGLLHSTPAQARVFVGIGFPCCFAPGPYYYGYPYYYYPPPPPYYPPAAYYPPPPGPAAPVAAPVGQPTPITPQISYTSRPAFINAAGQQCREFRSAAANSTGTACRDASGQWRVTN